MFSDHNGTVYSKIKIKQTLKLVTIQEYHDTKIFLQKVICSQLEWKNWKKEAFVLK